MNVLKNLFILNASVEENIFFPCSSAKIILSEQKFVARGDYMFDIDEKYACKNGLPHKVCGFCFSVRYLLNFKCYKICVEEIPDYFVDKVSYLGPKRLPEFDEDYHLPWYKRNVMCYYYWLDY